MPGGMLSLSANGSPAGTGILWATLSRAGDANHTPQPGILRAYDAGNVTRELWNSQQNATRDTLGNFSKFSPPTVANGKVYVATLSNKLVVYGLIGPSVATRRRRSTPGVDQNLTSPATHDPDWHRDRRRQPGAARPAHDDVESRQRAGVRHVQCAERALDHAHVPGAGTYTDSPHARSTVRQRRATT